MSFLEMLLSQKAVGLLLAAAGLFLVLGILFTLLPIFSAALKRFRTAATNRAESRAKATKTPPVSAAAPEEIIATSAPDGRTPQPAAASIPAPTTVIITERAPAATVVIKQAEAAKTAKPDSTTPSTPERTANSAMQDILSSVFADDETNGDAAILLDGTQPVNINDLVAFAHSVADRLAPVDSSES